MVTGAAGFIGTHLTAELIRRGASVLGVDDFSSYYSPGLKQARQEILGNVEKHPIEHINLAKPISLKLVKSSQVDAIVHLAAQPGVRLPPSQYFRYMQANVVALANVFEFASASGIPYVLYASSSSVYGDGTPTPFRESHPHLKPRSFYGSTKLAGEEIARSYCQSTGVSARGMRFFTVYGPWGRPDMAYFRLIAAALGEWDFTLTGTHEISRDFTFVKDTVVSTLALLDDLIKRSPGHHDVVNVGGGQSRTMGDLIEVVHKISGSNLAITKGNLVEADMAVTEADFSLLEELTGQHPSISLEDGLDQCLAWAARSDVKPQLRHWIEST